MNDESYRLYLSLYELIEWWKRYESLGPEGGLRQRLYQTLKLYEKHLGQNKQLLAKEFYQQLSRK